MSQTDQTFDTIAHGMLRAFHEKLVNSLVETAIKNIRPIIRAAAEQAVKELQARCEGHMDERLQRATIALIVKGSP